MERRPDTNLGTTLAGYRLERLLGRGGMGLVYLAEDLRLGRKVALKLLAPELAEDERFRERFLRESRLAASLDHPSVIPIYEAGEEGGQLYLAMRYVEGTDLRSLLEHGPLPPERALPLLAQVASALDAAHGRGLVHRDVKPANILLAGEHAYLADFGLTKRASSRSGLTETGQLAGTVDYIAPEQIRGETVDGRADEYSLACILHECLTGAPPFARDNEVAALWGHIQEVPPAVSERRRDVSAQIDPVVARGLAKAPADRYGTCGELVREAAQVLAPESAPSAGARISRDRLVIAVLAGVLALAAAATSALVLTRGSDGPVVVRPNSLVAIDPDSNEVVGQAKVGLVPIAALEAHGAVWVANATEHSVTRVDRESFEPGTAVGFSGAPVALVADPVSLLAVTTHYPQSLVQINVGDLTQPTSGTTVLTETSFGDISLSSAVRAAGDFWITVPEDAAGHDVVRVDSSYRVVKRIDAVGGGADLLVPRGAAGLAAGAGAVWVVDANGHVARIDPATNRVRRVTALEASPQAIAFGAGAVWVADRAGKQVWRLDAKTGRPTGTIPVGSDPVGIAVGKGAVWVANRGSRTVSRIDPATRRVVTVRVGVRLESVSVGSEYVWVTVSGADAVVS